MSCVLNLSADTSIVFWSRGRVEGLGPYRTSPSVQEVVKLNGTVKPKRSIQSGSEREREREGENERKRERERERERGREGACFSNASTTPNIATLCPEP